MVAAVHVRALVPLGVNVDGVAAHVGGRRPTPVPVLLLLVVFTIVRPRLASPPLLAVLAVLAPLVGEGPVEGVHEADGLGGRGVERGQPPLHRVWPEVVGLTGSPRAPDGVVEVACSLITFALGTVSLQVLSPSSENRIDPQVK